ncbi:non-specific lipid transfer protein GPI-anchored 1-like [Silene latifolia]|uniref:non-specific lipid transfer protein GPI-anchored 1-like n=1 Tax=Silene latifolia TaxID=37657 RepID=UPI003D777E23
MGSRNLMMTKLVLLTICLQGLLHMRSSEGASLTMQCSPAITAVTSCLGFATGKSPEPTTDCCKAVGSMKETQPVCLCFFIGQAHNGSAQITSLGIQEDKLIQLPSACHLANASITNCPKLLGISPSSPAAAIFLHNNATSPAGPISSSSSSTATPNNSGGGFKHEHDLLGGVLAVFVSAFLCSPSIQNFKLLF